MITHEEPQSLWRRLRGPSHHDLFEMWFAIAERGDQLRLSYSKRIWGLILALALGYVAVVVWDVVEEGALGELAVAVLALPFIWMAGRRLGTRHPAVVVEERGVYVDRLGELVPWSEIHGASTSSVPNGPDNVFLEVTVAWAKGHTQHLAPIRQLGLVAYPRKGHARLKLARGLECPPRVLAAWINGRPYDPEPEHLIVLFGVDGQERAEVVDPSGETLFDLVLRLQEGKRSFLSVTHIQSDPDGGTILIVLREPAQPMVMIEHRAGVETGRRELPDIATVAEQVVAWVRERDAESGRSRTQPLS